MAKRNTKRTNGSETMSKAEAWMTAKAIEIAHQIQKEVLPTAPDYVRQEFARPSVVRRGIAARVALLAGVTKAAE
ncbi:MAG: hypothetical protein ACM359_00955 [Bacillota bacterium]